MKMIDMKKLILLAASACICAAAGAFTLREHATVAYIAEKHLTPEARAVIDEILQGEHLYEFSSYPDFFRTEWINEEGKEIRHSYYVDMDMYPTWKGAGGALRKAVAAMGSWRSLSQEERIKNMSIIIHLMGDVHCPSHVKYADGRDKMIKVLYYKSKPKSDKSTKVSFHAFWDSWALSQRYCGGYVDMAQIIDTWPEEKVARVQKGDLRDWIHDSAFCCKDIFDVADESEIDRPYVIRKGDVAKNQVRNAGYRLAALLNRLFGK